MTHLLTLTTSQKFPPQEQRQYDFQLVVTDAAGASATADVAVKIESVDEFHPAFESASYKYRVDRLYPAGHILGRVKAVDQDAGPDGRVVYSLADSNNAGYFHVDPDTGELSVARNLDTGLLLESAGSNPRPFQDVSYVVQASTGARDSLKTSTLVIFQVKTDILPPAPLPATAAGGGLAAWGTALIIALVFILIIVAAAIFFVKRFSVNRFLQKRLIDPHSPGAAGVGGYSNADTGTLDSTVPMSQYSNPAAPPQYSDIVSQGWKLMSCIHSQVLCQKAIPGS